MAIQHRRGAYADFDPSKMKPGEFAVVQSGDPDANDGEAVYMAFQAGNVKRMATHDEMNQLNEQVQASADAAAKSKEDAANVADLAQKAYEKTVKKGEEIARVTTNADEIAKQALASASNAENDVAEFSNQLDSTNQKVQALQANADTYAQDGEVDNTGRFWLLNNGVRIAGPFGPFAGTGGGGGSSSGNSAELTVTDETGWRSKTISSGASCPITLTWSSLEGELATGNGSMRIMVNSVIKAVLDIQQGGVTVDLAKYCGTGTNSCRITISDVYDNNRTFVYTVQVVELSISSTFDATAPYTGAILFPYTPVGAVSKTVHFLLDGNQIGAKETSVSGRQMTFTIPAQSHGAHTFDVYFDCTINDATVESNHLHYEIICVETLNDTPIIVSPFNETETTQYTTLHISYTVYNPADLTADITISANGTQVSKQTVDRTEQVFNYRADDVGTLTIVIACGSVEKTITLNVTESDIKVEAETESQVLYLSSYGRSNNEENPAVWKSGDIACTFSGFNWKSDGWVSDDNGITVMRVAGDARITIPYQLFGKDFRTTGKTIELEFATRDVMNYDSIILSCMSGGRGLQMSAQAISLKSEQSEISTQYKEDEHVRISFVVQKKTENRLLLCYINGIMSGAVQYSNNDDFAQASPVSISIGSNDCTLDLYNIRIYDNDLTRYQVLTNWIADSEDVTDLLDRYRRNNVYDEYGNVVIADLPTDLPYMILSAPELPQYKGDKKTVDVTYVDPVTPSYSFTAAGAQANVQGTSSQYYPRKNYKIKFNNGFTLNNGTSAKKYALRSGQIPVSTFTMKADVASSEGANNVELVRLYNAACTYQTPPQKENDEVRQGIDGYPMVMFWDNGETTTFIGKYNFNYDKGTEETYGFSEGDESWEILNNTSNRVLWKSADYDSTITNDDGTVTPAWLSDFEGRYPDGNEDPTNLKQISEWLVSTDQSQATGKALAASVTYDGTTYTTDTAAYRLAKFKAEFTNYFEKDSAIFYYLFTELFLMVDSRAKNAFPSMIGGDKWCWLPYDMDTAIGINNEGSLVFSYNLEDIDQTEDGADVFNGQHSVMWVNLRQAFYADIKKAYQSLRSTGALSYAKVEKMFEDHQAVWPEAIFNEDAYFKYLQPLIDEGTGAYLAMLQGSKAEQRKWWLYNRFRYIDSKYNAGDALSDVIQLRGYSKADITVTPYADVYATVKYGSVLQSIRAARSKAVTIPCPLDNVNDTEIYVYSASQLASVGDLSGLQVGFADFSMATKIQSIKLGDSASTYNNQNLKELYLGNNVLLRTLDIRNCTALGTGDMKSVDISGCVNIENVYFDGTQITGVDLPNGGILKTLHLPATITSLILLNQPSVTDLTIGGYTNISTLRIENCPTVDTKAVLKSVPAGTRVRLMGFYWTAADAAEISSLLDILDGMRGLDEKGGNTDTAQLQGEIHTTSLTGAEIASFNERYPYLRITADHTTSNLFYYNWDGSTLLNTETITDGADGTYTGTPSRDSTAQYSYSFIGWSKKTDQYSADSTALKAVTADRKVYAAYSRTVRTYTVYFYNGSTLLQTVQNVAYGSSATYTGSTPVSSQGSADDYPFEGWSPAPTNIKGNTSCYAVYGSPLEEKEITDTWEQIIAACADGTYKDKYKLGNYKPLDLGSEGTVNMVIVGKNADALADGSGTAPLSFVSKELLKTSHRWNPSLATNYNTNDYQSWVEDTDNSGYKSNNQSKGSTSATETFTISVTTAGTLTVSYKVGSERNYDKLTVTVNGTTAANAISGSVDWTDYTLECAAGDTVTVNATYSKDGSGDQNGDTAYIKFSSTGTISVSAAGTTYQVKTVKDYQEATGTIGGWEKSEIRSYYQNTLKPLIPEAVRNALKTVTKYSRTYDTSGTATSNYTTSDDVWAPSYREVFNSGESLGPVYKVVFSSADTRKKMKIGASSAAGWWLRSASDTNYANCVGSNGGYYSYNVGSTYALALGFSL